VPSQAPDLHNLLRAAEFASAGRLPIPALPNSHMRAGCQFLRCRIHICVQAAPAYAAEFCDSPNSRQPIPLTRLGQSLSSPCSSTICATDFPLTNLQPHKSALPISPTDGMAASTLRPCFGQPAEACTSCTFDTVTPSLFNYP